MSIDRVVAETNLVDWPKDLRKDDYYINEEGMYELLFSSEQPKAKAFKKYCCNTMFPHIRQRLTNKMEEDQQQAIQERDNRIQTIQYENIGLQDEIRAKAKDQQIAALQRRHMGYLANKDKKNGITIIAKSNEAAECPYISICGQHSNRKQKARVLLACNQGSTLFAEGDTPNAIVTYNIWREHRLIVVDPNRPRNFRLDMINQEQLLALNNT